MQFSSTNIPYQQTKSFSKLVIDYLNQKEELHPFFKYSNNNDGIEQALKNRNYSKTTRAVLTKYFNNQYLLNQVMSN